YEVQDSFSFAQHARPLLTANCSEYAVAHAAVRLQPARQMSEISFLPHILHTMRRLRLTQLLRLQSYAWPYLSRGAGHGAVIVSAPRSGRTLSYVPPLCQVVCTALTEQRCHRPRWHLLGPIAVVLAADLNRVQQIGSLCNAMLRKAKNEEWLALVLTVPSARTTDFFHRLLNGVGCLVATPAQLLWLCNCGLITMPHLRFIVYDDVDLMPPEQLHKAHQQLLALTKGQPQQPQAVIISQSYNARLLHMLCEFDSHPMVLFGDVLEAALYGGARMRLSLLKREAKREELLQLLRQRSPHRLRTVISCHTDADIDELVQTLTAQGYDCLPYYQTADMDVLERVHRWMQDTRGELLLCTDACPELEIRHAHTLVHYSLSDSWSKFKLRHLALADNLRNQFAQMQKEQQTQQKSEQVELLSMVFLDESNNKQLPRLVDFLQMHQRVDEGIVLVARDIRDQLQRAKCNEPALCDLLLSLGECVDTQCEERHQLLPQDRLLPQQFPVDGDVKLQLVRVYSPAHYCVRLLEHLPPGGSWTAVPRRTSLELQLQLLQSQESVRHWPPRAKEICVYRNEHGYERVRILRVDPIERINLSRTDVAVEVQALDVDTRQFKTVSGKLYVCPEELRQAPPLALDLRILGLVPYTGERSWHEEDGRQCADWLSAVPQPHFLQASIVVSLSHTIFVRDLAATSYAPSLKMHVRRFSMCEKATRQQLARKCQHAVARLMAILKAEKAQLAQQQIEEISEKPIEMQQNEKQFNLQLKPIPLQVPAANTLTGRRGYFAKLAVQLARENSKQQQEKEERPKEQLQQQRYPQSQQPQSEDCIEALYKCLMNCTLLELDDMSQEEQAAAGNVPDKLLNQIIASPKAEQRKATTKKVQQRNKSKATAAVTDDSGQEHHYLYHMPANIVRPDVIYYQTACTLELQVLLPQDNMQYEAMLHNGCCICFWTLTTPEVPSYQFTLNTQCPYEQLSARQQGRTVYLSILKTLAIVYPLDFSFYKFMKPQHEKLNDLEEKRRALVSNFENYLLHRGYIQ
ncbi:hypothetical protein KR222_002630, partial [Zaprionus bogoriensis]